MSGRAPRDLLVFLKTRVFPHASLDILESLLSCSKVMLLERGDSLTSPGLYIVYSGVVEADSQRLEPGDYVFTEEAVAGVEDSIVVYAPPDCARPLLSMTTPETCTVGELVYRDPVVATPGTPVAEAVKTMYREGVSSIIVVEEGRPVGIFTDTDLRRIVALGQALDEPLEKHMTRDPVGVSSSTTCLEAVRLMMERYIKHLLVMDGDRLAGVVTIRDIAYAEALGPLYMLRRIRRARDTRELRREYEALLRLLRREARRLHPVASSGEAVHIIRMASLALRGVVARAAELAAGEQGVGESEAAYIVMGSSGRLEQFIASDRDTMLVYYGLSRSEARSLAEAVEALLDEIGFPGCRQGFTARRLLYSWDELESLVGKLASSPTGENLVLLSMFMDAETVWGREETGPRLRRLVVEALSRSKSYVLEALPAYRPRLGIRGRLPRRIDLKAQGLAPIVYAVKAFAAASSLWEPTNTLDRLRALVSRQVIPGDLGSDAAEAYNVIAGLAAWAQALQGSTVLDTGGLSGFERNMLREALRAAQRLVDYARRH